MNLVEFTEFESGRPLFVNPAYVTQVCGVEQYVYAQGKHAPSGKELRTVIHVIAYSNNIMQQAVSHTVKGSVEQAAAKLSTPA